MNTYTTQQEMQVSQTKENTCKREYMKNKVAYCKKDCYTINESMYMMIDTGASYE